MCVHVCVRARACASMFGFQSLLGWLLLSITIIILVNIMTVAVLVIMVNTCTIGGSYGFVGGDDVVVLIVGNDGGYFGGNSHCDATEVQ